MKPLPFVKNNLLHRTNEGAIILDCYCGSGTTCIAAKELNRQFIGIEIN
ncbi:MAG: DNA methyltransferase [Erysipelotrichaceae bacterium]